MNVESLKNEELITMMKEYEGDQTFHKDYIWEVWDEVSKRGFLPRFFGFRDENTNIRHLLPITCSEKEFDDWVINDYSEAGSFVAMAETEYGVHDGNSYMSSEREVYGFSSYEVEEEEKIKELLSKWKEKLIELGWSKSEDQWSEVVEENE